MKNQKQLILVWKSSLEQERNSAVKILVTGCAGFIGSHLTERLLDERRQVIGIDNFNDYYDLKIKERNSEKARENKNFKLHRVDILNFSALTNIFEKERPEKIIHLAARAGVRPSINNPLLYAKVNVLGTVNLLRLSADYSASKFILGSSSSVYGNSKRLPFSEDDQCDAIISPYGASKRAAEFWVETFYRTYGLKSAILRFFTVYGPRGRPDMAPALFTKAILNNEEITQFGDGSSSRDYTYVDDIVNGIVKTLEHDFDFKNINLGNNHPITLIEFITTLEKVTGKKAPIKNLPKQKGDVEKTWSDITKAKNLLGWTPNITLEQKLEKMIEDLKSSYRL